MAKLKKPPSFNSRFFPPGVNLGDFLKVPHEESGKAVVLR